MKIICRRKCPGRWRRRTSKMLAEIGSYILILGLVCALAQTIIGLFKPDEKNLIKRLSYAQCALMTAAFTALIILFVITDLSVLNIIQNSHTQKPFLYKIAASWASHEGSMLLWCLMLSVFGIVIACYRDMPGALRQSALGIQGALSVGFLSFLIFTSNPFDRVAFPPYDGQDLNPILQDPSLAIHPPMLFLGYVGFSAQFALAIAALLNPSLIGPHWVRIARFMTLVAWAALTAGLCLGSYWAYYELGWGGWWFWDPVENAALMPWLTGTALLHSLRVQELRGSLVKWTIMLSILTFGLSVMGTFLVRSGLLTSVHSFAVDPERGLFILGLAGFYIGGGLLLYALRAKQLSSPVNFSPASRETVLVLNNLILLTMVITVLIGTAYPVALPMITGREISVGASYFNTVLLPLAIPMLVLMGAGIFLDWKKTRKQVWRRIGWMAVLPFLLAVFAAIATISVYEDAPLAAGFWIGLGVWLMAGVVQYTGGLRNAAYLTRHQKAMALAHFGVGLAILGMVGSGLLMKEREALMAPGERIEIGRYIYEMADLKPVIGPNYLATQARFDITQAQTGDRVTQLTAERRTYPIAGSKTTETGIATGLLKAHYVALGEADPQSRQWIVRVQIHPLIIFLWVGMGLVVLSGIVHIRGSIKRDKEAQA